MTLTFGSLFAGIGGFDLGLERAGMRCLWQVEIDEFCNKVLAKHWPDVRRYKDVRKVKGIGTHGEAWNTEGTGSDGFEYLEPVDVLVGGFPCQPHSLAGKRKGKEDDRDLWPEYLRLINEIRPRWVIGENVSGIITTILDEVLSDLEGAGYTCETLIIPACAFNAPHRRDRVFVVVHTLNPGNRTPGHGVDGNRSQEIGGQKNELLGRIGRCGEVVGNSSIEQVNERDDKQETGRTQIPQPGNSGGEGDVPNTPSTRLERQVTAGELRSGQQGRAPECNQWAVEPGVGRVAHGVPNRVDRLRSLGNAVVPQVVEFIGRAIMEVA